MAISDWRSALTTWWGRRRRFAEEWAFHREAAIAEFEALGYNRRRARKAARCRMGAHFRHRTSALAAIGGDLPGLWRLLPIRSVTRSALFVPAMLAVVVTLALMFNPDRGMAVRSIRAMLFCADLPATERMIPLTPVGVVPVAMAGALLRMLLIAGLVWAASNLLPRKSFRAFLYSFVVLVGIVIAGAVSWVTGMQLLACRSWGHDGIQVFALLAFLFAFVGMLYVAMSRWWIDVERRCPYCLRLPGLPDIRGNPHDVLVNPLEIESICFRGHGSVLESRWRRRFQAASEGAL